MYIVYYAIKFIIVPDKRFSKMRNFGICNLYNALPYHTALNGI